MRIALNYYVFFAGAAVRWPSRKRKSISRRVTSQTKKKISSENDKAGRIFAQKNEIT